MSASRRRLALALAASIVVALSFIARLLSARTVSLPVLAELPAFRLVDEHGATLDREALLGKVTIVDFVFTSCTTACPLLSSEMAKLQTHIVAAGLRDRARLLSISVDPDRDTEARLQAFANRYGADPTLWHFARGDEAALRTVVVDGMKQYFERQLDRGEVDGFTILHGTRFVLVDDTARIRGFYDSKDATDMANLRHALEALVQHRASIQPDGVMSP